MTPDEVAQVADLFTSSNDLFHLHQEIRRLSHESGSQAMESLSWATGYMRVWPEDDARFTFQPSIVWDNVEYPPPLDRLPPEGVADWAAWADALSEPLLVSRLHHLLWDIRAEGAHVHAQRAIDAYVNHEALVNEHDYERCQDYGFALDLALRISDDERSTLAVSRIVEWLADHLKDDQASPGAILASLGHLVRLRKRERPENLAELLNAAAHRFANDPHLFDDVTGLLIAANQSSGREKEFASDAVSKWMDAARAAENPVLTAAFLNKARERAQASGLADERDSILAALMSNPLREGMHEISVSASVGRDDYERWIQSFTAHATLAACLVSFGAHQPAPENDAAARQMAEETLERQPLIALTTRVVTDEFGLPLIVATTHDDHLKVTMAHNDGLAIRVWGISASDVLDRLGDRWDFEAADQGELFTGPLISAEARRAFWIALGHYRRGDFESAVTLALPRIEESVRACARQAGVRVLEVTRPGAVQWRPLRSLLEDLEMTVPGRFTRYLNMVLVNQLGLNIRNRVLHGLAESVDKYEAALVLHVAARLSLLVVSPSE